MADVVLPSGERIDHHMVTMPAAAMTVVVNEAGDSVLMSWRHRFIPDVWNYEIPGGLVERGEDPQAAAVREVLEETGYRPRTMRHLVTFEPMIGTITTLHHLYLALGAEKVAEPTERNEGRFEWIAIDALPTMISHGLIANSGMLIGVLHFLALGQNQ